MFVEKKCGGEVLEADLGGGGGFEKERGKAEDADAFEVTTEKNLMVLVRTSRKKSDKTKNVSTCPTRAGAFCLPHTKW